MREALSCVLLSHKRQPQSPTRCVLWTRVASIDKRFRRHRAEDRVLSDTAKLSARNCNGSGILIPAAQTAQRAETWEIISLRPLQADEFAR
jgi:hypothetical protein